MPLDVSAEDADRHLMHFFEAHRRANGRIELPLRVPLEDFSIPGDISLGHEAVITVSKRRDEQNLNDVYAIEWHPSDATILPAFYGVMFACASANGEPPYLELDGRYEPPLGDAGEAFDATIGHLIAQRTANAFLSDVADGVYALARKPAHR